MVIWEKPVQSYPLEEFGTREPKSVRLIDAQIAAEAAGAAILVAEDKGLIDASCFEPAADSVPVDGS